MSSRSLPSLRRPILHLSALVLPLLTVPALRASTITYDVTLTPTSGQYGGSGTLTLASAPATSGISTFSQANGQLQGLSFTIDNQTFSLAGDPSATVEFLNGQIYNISFAQTVGSSPNRFTLDTSGVYAFYYDNDQAESAGSITADVSPGSTDSNQFPNQQPASPTPEPSSLLLLATALFGGCFLIFRRRGTAQS